MVAIKCIRRTSLNKRATENLMTEIELLKRLKHRHIVELHDFEVWTNTDTDKQATVDLNCLVGL